MSANSVNPHSCSVCGAEGHGVRRCTELAPPPDGFWKGQRMPDDEGDECRRMRCSKKRVLLLKIRSQSTKRALLTRKTKTWKELMYALKRTLKKSPTPPLRNTL